ncbi:hypothetical protein MP228_006171 [Amoeboaphelidium protococcarum]|nr:hypothetical protein MP228_006171 [Amoeboaphelidium protococcarum]
MISKGLFLLTRQSRFMSVQSGPLPPLRIARDGESIDTMRARLLYQSRKRGILESDLLCSTFAQKHLHTLSHQQLQQYDRLLDENDWDLYYWTAGQKEVPEHLRDNEILKMMTKHFKNEGRKILKMPSLDEQKN